jgi:hypothetical protein
MEAQRRGCYSALRARAPWGSELRGGQQRRVVRQCGTTTQGSAASGVACTHTHSSVVWHGLC